LFWFRAFPLTEPEAIVAVLRRGDQPHSDPAKTTRRNEVLLGIQPPRVYYYLGRTLEEFGAAVVVFDQSSLEGELSPFDTGGLLDYHQPVCSWEDSARRAFLADFSWSSERLAELLAVYPGQTHDAIARYLAADRPVYGGPADIWPCQSQLGTIWRDASDWRAWTWECRVVPPTSGQGGLRYWSCSATQFQAIMAYAYTLTDEDDIREMEALLNKFVRGGTSVLVKQLIHQQESAA